MNRPKNQHYIPQMLSKRFANQEGKLYVYDKNHPEKGVQKKDPKKTFVRRHLYSQEEEDGTRDVSVETEFLAPLESDASPVIEKIISAARMKLVPKLSAIEKRAFLKFFYYQMMRLPAVRNNFVDEVSEELTSYLEAASRVRPLNTYEQALLEEGDARERHLKNASVNTLRSSPVGEETIDEIVNGSLCVAAIKRPKPNRSFIISDFPYIRLTDRDLFYHDNRIIEIWLPLASDVAVALTPGRFDKLRVLKDRKRETLNQGVFSQSTVIAGCSRELIESFRRRAN